MICYTLHGPRFTLEIHDDKIKLIKRAWWKLLSRENEVTDWQLSNLSHFEMTIPPYIIFGKLEWTSFDGQKGSFRFTTNHHMVGKIEKYMQKKIMKNYQRHPQKAA